jgi:predicted LPLAT superfamily acyltransferase
MEVNPQTPVHNPGPPWGFRFIRFGDKLLPNPLNGWIKRIGALVALTFMVAQRRHSKAYLTQIYGGKTRFIHVWNHFSAFTFYLCDRVRAAFKEPILFDWVPGCGKEFVDLINKDDAALMGTFHVGYSDLMGFFTEVFKKKIHMLRLRLENSEDTQRLESMAGDFLKIIWVNQVEDTLYALKDVLQAGGTVAMQCDRVQHASKLEAFDFLGEKRLFPFSIYTLSILFQKPVIFVVAARAKGKERIPVVHSPIFFPDKETKAENIAAAKAHFQSVLNQLEALLKEDPYIWFNFEALNPVAKKA